MTASTVSIKTVSAHSNTVLRTGVKAGLVAAAATTTFAAVAHASGVSLDIAGEPIPGLAFAQLTFVLSMVGVAIAAVLRRKAKAPQSTFVRTTIALTTLSLVPDAMANAAVSTKFVLMATHLIAAAIVVPSVAKRLSN
jgi:hypothetical protein